jgi:hypothetical protein
MYFNLKVGAKEEDLVKNLEEYSAIAKKYVKGWGGYKLYKHYYFGENRRHYQLWLKIKNFATIDSEIDAKYDPKVEKLVKEKIHDKGFSFYDLVDIDEHIDEVVSEVYPVHERPDSKHR